MKLAFLFARTFLYKILNAVLGFLVINTMTTYYVSPENRGIYTDLNVYSGVYVVVLTGFGYFISYAINRLKTPLEKVVPMGLFFYTLTGILTLLFLPFLWMHGFLTAKFSHIFWVFFLIGSPFIVMFGYCSRLLQALNRIDLLNNLNLVQVVTLSVALGTLWFLKRPDSDGIRTILICSFWVVSQVVSGLVALYAVKKVTNISFRPKWNREFGKDFFTFGGTVAAASLIERVNDRLDYILTDTFAESTKAIYGLAITAAETLTFISSSISTIVFTRIAGNEWTESRRVTEMTFRVLFVAVCASALIGALIGPLVIHAVFPPHYSEAIQPFLVQLIGLALAGPKEILMNFFTNQLKNPRISIYMDLIAIAISAPICIYLIPRYGIVGAAWGSTAAYTSQFVLCVLFYELKAGKGSLYKFSLQDWQFLRRRAQ